jgi:hypothetical protein
LGKKTCFPRWTHWAYVKWDIENNYHKKSLNGVCELVFTPTTREGHECKGIIQHAPHQLNLLQKGTSQHQSQPMLCPWAFNTTS